MSMLLLGVGLGIGVACIVGWLIGLTRRHGEHEVAEARPEPRSVPGLEDVLDGHPTGVVVADPGRTIWFTNAAARAWQGTHAGLLLDAAIERHLTQAAAGRSDNQTVEFYGPPRQVFVITSHPLRGGGAVAFVDDISERRRIEQVRTDFVANISHELKTPIGAMSVLAETLIDEHDHQTVQRIVNRMLAEADRAAQTIEDLMELSRIESGGDRIVEDVRVADILKGALDRVGELASQRNISIATLEPVDGAAQRSHGLIVRGDLRQLVSAVGNLVENAVKYSDPGTSVQMRAKTVDGWVEVSVSDQGPGIPKRDLDRIFERFYRVDRARSRTTGGTGLGLAIVRHVASNHGGVVHVSSVEGEGSTFVLRLPTDQRATTVRSDGDVPTGSDEHHPRPVTGSHDQGVA